MMNRQLSRSTVTLVVSVVIAMGLLVGLIVGRWLSLLGLTGLEVFDVDQESRGTLAAEEELALRLMIGMGNMLLPNGKLQYHGPVVVVSSLSYSWPWLPYRVYASLRYASLPYTTKATR